jgi:hypothetical protein
MEAEAPPGESVMGRRVKETLPMESVSGVGPLTAMVPMTSSAWPSSWRRKLERPVGGPKV